MDSMGQAYGAGLAGGGFDPLSFIKKPTVILRLISLLFSIIIFGCISSGGWYYPEEQTDPLCKFGDDAGACGFGTAIGVIGFMVLLIFLGCDAYFGQITSVQLRKQVVIGDLGASAFGTFLMFVNFCLLTNKWNAGNISPNDVGDKNNPQAAIAFSFFSIFTWAGLTLFAFRRYHEGAADAFAPDYNQDLPGGGLPYAGGGYAGDMTGQSYQEPPFTASNDAGNALPQHYQQQPTY